MDKFTIIQQPKTDTEFQMQRVYGKTKKLIDQMADCGVMQVELTGGEPLVRPDFLQLLDRMREHSIFVTQIYTNGALVDEAFLNELEKRQHTVQGDLYI